MPDNGIVSWKLTNKMISEDWRETKLPDGVEYYTKEEVDKKLWEQEPLMKAVKPDEIYAALKLLQIEKEIAEPRGQSYDAALRTKE